MHRLYGRINIFSNASVADSATNSEDDRVPPPLPAKNQKTIDASLANNEVVDVSNCTSPYETYNLSFQSLIEKVSCASKYSE
jgi:hypothetical protein